MLFENLVSFALAGVGVFIIDAITNAYEMAHYFVEDGETIGEIIVNNTYS